VSFTRNDLFSVVPFPLTAAILPQLLLRPPCRSKHGGLLRQNRLFWLFAAVVKSPNCRFFAKGVCEIDEFAAFFANCDRRECLWYERCQEVDAIVDEHGGNREFTPFSMFNFSTNSTYRGEIYNDQCWTENSLWQQQQQRLYLLL
jgi:hypothetical protein